MIEYCTSWLTYDMAMSCSLLQRRMSTVTSQPFPESNLHRSTLWSFIFLVKLCVHWGWQMKATQDDTMFSLYWTLSLMYNISVTQQYRFAQNKPSILWVARDMTATYYIPSLLSCPSSLINSLNKHGGHRIILLKRVPELQDPYKISVMTSSLIEMWGSVL